jgi:DNA-binding transcriptional LysR family regulator
MEYNSGMDYNLLKYQAFLKTVELGSLSEAALSLSYTESAVSRMIHDLEESFGFSLLSRSRQGVFLTPEGKALLPRIQCLCQEASHLNSEAQSQLGLTSGHLTIATFSSVCTYWLPPMISRFQKDYPGIDYELLLGDYDEINDWVRKGKADLGFTSLPAQKGLQETFLEEDSYLAVLPITHPLAKRKSFPVQAFEKEPFLLLEKGSRQDILSFFEKNHLSPRIRFKTWDDYAIMAMIEKGLGISLLPSLILKRISFQVLLKPLDKPFSRKIGYILPENRAPSLAVQKFIDYLPYRKEN